MKILSLLSLFLFISCSMTEEKGRKTASVDCNKAVNKANKQCKDKWNRSQMGGSHR